MFFIEKYEKDLLKELDKYMDCYNQYFVNEFCFLFEYDKLEFYVIIGQLLFFFVLQKNFRILLDLFIYCRYFLYFFVFFMDKNDQLKNIKEEVNYYVF